jgi:hypothetical protein
MPLKFGFFQFILSLSYLPGKNLELLNTYVQGFHVTGTSFSQLLITTDSDLAGPESAEA